ncbi:DNA polymerase alpha subunit B N-terminal-domain-containing protein [Elsinoe ampelina]|uniref:DNA polymerase alpha subunit B n=1 Tax=Elsinoe ampelina TaxID=302913 RepID=A0A6A6GK05_9PEZI|nr:DNA polymerase alpha subunit B N-terminal-domain-containing protein [Elsinoe ampelina]
MSITELSRLFAQPNQELPEDVYAELQSILRLLSLSEQELFYKWEAYSLKLGSENTHLNYKTVRDFKKDLQDALERESRGKAQVHSSKKTVNNTPRPANNGDVYGVLDGLVSGTPAPRTAIKRRNEYDTPSAKVSKTAAKSSPHGPTATPDGIAASFADRVNPGQVIESLNSHITSDQTDETIPAESRVKLKANTEISKFNYKAMAMKLSEASEILDDRIDEFTALVQEKHGFPESAFGNPAARSTAEIIAVGRISSDTEGSINAASLVLETSRRMGAGLRVPLKIDNLPYDFFPGKIVAVRGINASGDSFHVSEIISIPHLSLPASQPSELDTHNARLAGSSGETSDRPLSLIVAAGPYTTDSDLSYDALNALLDRAATSRTDVVILNGPFLDLEHPLIASGDITLPPSYPAVPDLVTLTDAFKAFISQPLTRLTQQSPNTTVILVPSVRDAVLKHVSWPQDRLPKRELGLPKAVTCVTNPITLSINELVVGISSQDVLYEMQRQLVSQGSKGVADDLLARLTSSLIQQRHFFPVFPPLDPARLPKPSAYKVEVDGLNGEAEQRTAIGACLDTSYLKLGEWVHVRPDLLITPSVLTPFAKVVDSVVAVNPGVASKRKAAGTFAELRIKKREVKEDEMERDVLGHELFNRARVDIVRV